MLTPLEISGNAQELLFVIIPVWNLDCFLFLWTASVPLLINGLVMPGEMHDGNLYYQLQY